MPKYRANVGLNYPDPKTGEEVRVEAGDVLDHLPAEWLLENGYVSRMDEITAPLTTAATSVPPQAGG